MDQPGGDSPPEKGTGRVQDRLQQQRQVQNILIQPCGSYKRQREWRSVPLSRPRASPSQRLQHCQSLQEPVLLPDHL